MPEIVRSAAEVLEMAGKLPSEAVAGGRGRYPGMNYEQGVDDTVRWLLGETDDSPTDEM